MGVYCCIQTKVTKPLTKLFKIFSYKLINYASIDSSGENFFTHRQSLLQTLTVLFTCPFNTNDTVTGHWHKVAAAYADFLWFWQHMWQR